MSFLVVSCKGCSPKRLLERCKELDFEKLAKEVEQFLFVPADAKKVLYFCPYIKEIDF
jgi:hypothetical protein